MMGRGWRYALSRVHTCDTPLTGPELTHETTKTIAQIKDRLNIACNHQISYVTVRRKIVEF